MSIDQLRTIPRQCDTIPIIISWYSWSWKDTVVKKVIQLHQGSQDLKFNYYNWRYTDRSMRPTEINEYDWFFVSEEEFTRRLKDWQFFYSYEKISYWWIRYWFRRKILFSLLRWWHTFIIWWEIQTAFELYREIQKLKLKNKVQDWSIDSKFIKTKKPIEPIIIFINREKDLILNGIRARWWNPEEIEKRIAHVESKWKQNPFDDLDENWLKERNLELNKIRYRMIMNWVLTNTVNSVMNYLFQEFERRCEDYLVI